MCFQAHYNLRVNSNGELGVAENGGKKAKKLNLYLGELKTKSPTYSEAVTPEVLAASPLSHDTVMQLILLFDVGMVSTRPLAAFAVVAAENGGQLLLGQPVGRQGDGAFLRQAPAVLHNTGNTEDSVDDRNDVQVFD